MRLYVNFFQPVMKLRHQTRHGAKVHKIQDTAKTPYRRVLERRVLSTQQRDALARQYERLDPVRLLAQIDPALDHPATRGRATGRHGAASSSRWPSMVELGWGWAAVARALPFPHQSGHLGLISPADLRRETSPPCGGS